MTTEIISGVYIHGLAGLDYVAGAPVVPTTAGRIYEEESMMGELTIWLHKLCDKYGTVCISWARLRQMLLPEYRRVDPVLSDTLTEMGIYPVIDFRVCSFTHAFQGIEMVQMARKGVFFRRGSLQGSLCGELDRIGNQLVGPNGVAGVMAVKKRTKGPRGKFIHPIPNNRLSDRDWVWGLA